MANNTITPETLLAQMRAMSSQAQGAGAAPRFATTSLVGRRGSSDRASRRVGIVLRLSACFGSLKSVKCFSE